MKHRKNSLTGSGTRRRPRAFSLLALLLAGLTLPVLVGAMAPAPAPGDGEGPTAGGRSRRAQARLAPVNRAGVTARIEFIDNGRTLSIRGGARGLDPRASYITLIYDNGSVATGSMACQPTIFDPTDPGFLLNTMFIGVWKVDKQGNGRLAAKNTNGGFDYVSLSRFKNVSVRRVIGPPDDKGGIPMTELVACGEVSATRN